MGINLGYFQGDAGKELKRVIESTARDMDMSPHDVALVMTYFLEHTADRVSMGKQVRIPGFGMFSARVHTHKVNGSRQTYPTFSAAVGFKQQVNTCCPPNMSIEKKVSSYRRSHHPSCKKKVSARVFTAMRKMRVDVESDRG